MLGRNTQDAMSALRTTDSALNSISNILLRMRDIATQSANGTNETKDQASLDLEFQNCTRKLIISLKRQTSMVRIY